MEKLLDAEKPDFVVLNGDNIASGVDSPLENKQALNNLAQPMEKEEFIGLLRLEIMMKIQPLRVVLAKSHA